MLLTPFLIYSLMRVFFNFIQLSGAYPEQGCAPVLLNLNLLHYKAALLEEGLKKSDYIIRGGLIENSLCSQSGHLRNKLLRKDFKIKWR